MPRRIALLAGFALLLALAATEASAAGPCLSLQRGEFHDRLVNRCDVCRIGQVQRRRPGSGPPAQRTVTVPADQSVALSFKGPGATRLLSDTPCRGPAAAEESTQRCAKLVRRSGAMLLVNACNACRMVQIRRFRGDGDPTLHAVGIGGGDTVPLASLGAQVVQIVSEQPCQ